MKRLTSMGKRVMVIRFKEKSLLGIFESSVTRTEKTTTKWRNK
jgi:hypothetical protein